MANPYRVTSVDRALVLLQMLGTGKPVSVSDAQKELGVAASTAHRLLSTLVGRNFALQGADRMYYAGSALLSPGRHTHPLAVVFRPFLEMLYNSTEETVHLCVLQGEDVYFIDGIEGRQRVRVPSRVGVHLPMEKTSAGKAVLACRAAGAPHDQPFIGVNVGETEPDVIAFGVTLGKCAGFDTALAIAIPRGRFDRAREARLRRELVHIAKLAHERVRDLPGGQPAER